MKIVDVRAREIFDCRGIPALECQIRLEDNIFVEASVPTGISKGSHEAFELRDGEAWFDGQGVQKAIEKIEEIIAPELINKQPDLIKFDQQLIEMDGTDNKNVFGANTILAVSIAVARAQAIVEGCELYEFIAQISGAQSVTLPFPVLVMISGGLHVKNGLSIQEFSILPIEAQNFKEAFEQGAIFFHALKKKLLAQKKSILTSTEGSFGPKFVGGDIEVLDFLAELIIDLKSSGNFKIGLDLAASHFFDPANRMYNIFSKKYDTNELINFYKQLVKTYPIVLLEDPLSQDDWEGWSSLMQLFQGDIQIAGDDLFATNCHRIWHGIEVGAANAALIKPNQIGTLTETIQAIQLCQQYGLNPIVSHRSGETNDTFIADLAVGSSAGQIKAGSCSRGERLAKYNRLLAIEDHLTLSLLTGS